MPEIEAMLPMAMPATDRVSRWLAAYRRLAGAGDVLKAAEAARDSRWTDMLRLLAERSAGDLSAMQRTVARQATDIGMAFRLPEEDDERTWPLGPVPLVIDYAEWRRLEEGLVQRAELLEKIVADIYGAQQLALDGALPAAAIAGSPNYWRQMIGANPAKQPFLQFIAVDLGRGPDGEWRVLADHTRVPAGAGYALENRIAFSRAAGALHTRLNVLRLAPFFAAFRDGIAAQCERESPRIGLLTPGRFNQSYPEQAHLARYLGFLLVEGADLAVRDDKLYVRTIEGLKRIDGLWRRLDTRFLDPLTFDVGSRIGTPGLFDAFLAGNLAIGNAPGVGVLESPLLAAFLPRLAQRLLGEALKLPNIATWWCGQPLERDAVLGSIDEMVLEAAFNGRAPAGLKAGRPVLGADLGAADRAALMAGMQMRPEDYVGREVVRLSTMPSFDGRALVPRPFTVRAFLARNRAGQWQVMPGGFARIANDGDVRATVMGEGAFTADVCVLAEGPVAPVSLIADPSGRAVRRLSGVLPSRAADAMFWLGRYIERGEMTARVIRSALGGSIAGDGGSRGEEALGRLSALLVSWGAAWHAAAAGDASIVRICEAALDSGEEAASVSALLGSIRGIAQGVRERISPDLWRLVDNPGPIFGARDAASLLERTTQLLDRFAALSGVAAENMVRGPSWRFHDLGRRLERAVGLARLIERFAPEDARADHLNILLDLSDSQISYRARYIAGLARDPVRDLVGLDPLNPRSLAFQVNAIDAHLKALPNLREDGMPEEPVRLATRITAALSTIDAEDLDGAALERIGNDLTALSDAIGTRFFLQGGEGGRMKAATRLA